MKEFPKYLVLLAFLYTPLTYANYQGSRFSDIWSTTQTGAYRSLPQGKVTFSSFYKGFTNLIQKSAKRTISNKNDVLPYFDKLLHKNGTCMAGNWEITEENPYTGYFEKGSKALIMARASTTLSNTRQGRLRGFGLAGKIFPTLNPDQKTKTANFFLIDNLGGTYADNFTRVNLSNEPGILPSFSFSLPFLAPIAATVGKAFSRADKNPGIRQVYSISNLGLKDIKRAITPKYMKFVGSSKEYAINQSDFRNELSEHINVHGMLTFDIFVASSKNSNGRKQWSKIGRVSFNDIIASEGCDHRLHFHHHKFKENL